MNLELLALGVLLVSSCGLCFVVPAPVGLGLGLLVWRMTARDLQQIKLGLMDPTDAVRIKRARERAILAVKAALLGTAIGGFVAFSSMEDVCLIFGSYVSYVPSIGVLRVIALVISGVVIVALGILAGLPSDRHEAP